MSTDDERRPRQEAPPEIAAAAKPQDHDQRTAAGIAAAEAGCDPWWWSNAVDAVRTIAATGQEFQAHDLVEMTGLREPDHPCRWGSLLAAAARAGVIVRVGAAVSRRPGTAGSLTRTWRGVRR